ncbi:MAG: Cytochrome c-type biogenesis protein CcmF [Gammaproteobacteria bacterium]|nr:Cytochrome c-type biogenesis protein CcmF [Gammaproteobacteria bacterium]
MIPELGLFALIVALGLAATLGVLAIVGAQRGDARWMAVARPAARAQFGFVAIAFLCLTYAFVANDFSVLYVATNSNSQLPLAYRVAAVWGGHEGSLLLWTLSLSGWMLAVTFFSRHLPEAMVARVLGVMGLVSVGFLLFMIVASNPFERLLPAAPEGSDLNPLLQDPGMVAHPPLLYMGYVGFSVAYAFAIAALLGGRLDATWARWSRPWTTIAWMFLTLGIAVGSGWAYYELGWGGWWFWDPVENASLMPWLVGTALVHSLAVTEKRGGFRAWTVLLAICAFALSLLGTFLVRSGVLSSVHAFATDPRRGTFILVFLSVVIGASLVLYALRAPRVSAGGSFAPVSRESMLLANNVLLLVAAGTVLLGTLYPLFLDALGLGKISVGPPYFETVMVPLMTPVLFLIGVGPIARWKKAALPELAVRLRWAAAVAVVTAVLSTLALGRWRPAVAFGLLMAAWIAASSVVALIGNARGAGRLGARLASIPRGYWGMFLAHLGLAVFVAGVTLVRGYESAKDVKMRRGDSVTLAGNVFTMQALGAANGPNYTATRATITVTRAGAPVATLMPEKRVYNASAMVMTEAAIDSGPMRDLYVSLGDRLDRDTWVVRVQRKPFIGWIWLGCVAMAAGGLLAATDRRYRLAVRRGQVLHPAAAPAAV